MLPTRSRMSTSSATTAADPKYGRRSATRTAGKSSRTTKRTVRRSRVGWRLSGRLRRLSRLVWRKRWTSTRQRWRVSESRRQKNVSRMAGMRYAVACSALASITRRTLMPTPTSATATALKLVVMDARSRLREPTDVLCRGLEMLSAINGAWTGERGAGLGY